LKKQRKDFEGIAPDEISRSKSLGLLGRLERALLFGWDLTLQGSSDKGTTVTLKIPGT
jgi:signal transduction histidine kinase